MSPGAPRPPGARAARRLQALLALGTALVLGCGSDRPDEPSPSAAVPEPAPPTFRDSASPPRPEVELLDAGSGTPRTLRVRPTPGDEQTFTVSSDASFSSTVGGAPGASVDMPTTRQRVRLVVQEVGPDGTIVLAMQGFAVELRAPEDGEGYSQEQLDQANAATATVLDFARGELVLSPLGFVDRISLRLPLPPEAAERIPPEQGDQLVGHLRGSFMSALDGALPALPEQAVGPGARWVVRQEGEKEGKVTREEHAYEIVGLDEERLDVAFRFTASAPEQSITLPGGAPGRVVGLDGRGEGEIHFDLARAIPTSGHVRSSATWQIEGVRGGETTRMTTSEVLAVRFTGE